MVGKLNDVVTAAVVMDSAPNTKPVGAQDFAQLKPVEPKPQDAQKAKEEEKKEQEGRLEPGTMTESSVSNMTDVLNDLMEKTNVNIQFKYNKDVDMLNVKMINKETNEVIKEFPPEEMIENMIKAKDWLGAFIDKAI